MRHGKLLFLFISMALFTLGCSSSTPTTTNIETEATQSPGEVSPTEVEQPPPDTGKDPFAGYPVEGYPAEDFATATPFDYTQEEGYPAAIDTPSFSDLPDELVIPTPQAASGVITGQLLTPGPDGEPYLTTLFLADTIPPDQEGYPPMIGFSEEDSPLAEQDKLGNFLFADVPPGTYALAIWSPISSTIIQEPDSPDYLLVVVEAGETTDLGIIGIP